MEKLYSISEVAEMLGLKYDQVWYMIMTRRLKARKVGWNWIISEEDIPKKEKAGGA